jgi:molybdenum cofactor cytidylyltransferase
LLLRACRLAAAVADAGVIVVLGAGALRLRCLLRRHRCHVTIVHNAGWREGMASSLRTGVARVPRGTEGLLITVVDQPRVGTADLERLTWHWRRRPGRPSAAFYQGRAGVPAVIPQRYFQRLRELRGDTGARQLLGRTGERSLLAMPAAAFDIDKPEDAAVL